MKSRVLLFFISSVLALCLNYCDNPIFHKKKTEGLIEFKVEPVDKSHPLAGLAPDKAIVKFKNGKYLVEMTTMGMFKTAFVLDAEKKTMIQTVKFMDIKNACIENQNEINKDVAQYPLTFKETNEKVTIAGYKCYKAIATYGNNPSDTFEVLYTKDLEPKDVNDLGPYKGIKGMLMKYRLKKMGLELEFTAEKVSLLQIPDEEFELPSYYKIISQKEMEEFFKSLQ